MIYFPWFAICFLHQKLLSQLFYSPQAKALGKFDYFGSNFWLRELDVNCGAIYHAVALYWGHIYICNDNASVVLQQYKCGCTAACMMCLSISDMLEYGCTRLEIGVQSVYEDVARDTNRCGLCVDCNIRYWSASEAHTVACHCYWLCVFYHSTMFHIVNVKSIKEVGVIIVESQFLAEGVNVS